jgi:ubiquitin-like modifier-activating enzyme ATG7
LLASFVILSFADLKKYKFYYWFGFPAIHSDPAWVPMDSAGSPLESRQSENSDTLRGEYLSSHESTALVDAVQTWSYGVDARQRGFFLARKERKAPGESAHSNWQVASLSEYENGFFTGTPLEHRYVCFADPSNYENAPGWMLRNLLVVVKQRWGLDRVQILRYRDVQSKRDQGRSVVIRLESKSDRASGTMKADQTPGELPKITGWERNPTGKLSGRIVSLTEYMDPTRYRTLERKEMAVPIKTDILFID